VTIVFLEREQLVVVEPALAALRLMPALSAAAW